MNIINIIRALVRPAISIAFSATILVIAHTLIQKFADVDMAKMFATFILATGSTIIGFWFGSRRQQ
jgi:hypothetical protein